VVLANPEVADKLWFCLPSFDSHGRHFSVVLTTAFVVVRSSQNCITSQGSHYYQATVGLKLIFYTILPEVVDFRRLAILKKA